MSRLTLRTSLAHFTGSNFPPSSSHFCLYLLFLAHIVNESSVIVDFKHATYNHLHFLVFTHVD